MAPRPPSQAKAALKSRPTLSQSPSTARPSTKASKRTAKHTALLHRIAKSRPAASTKRRRPKATSRLAKTLDGLAAALPGLEELASTGEKAQNADAVELSAAGRVRIRNGASLRSRPGAQKRRERLEGLEREWFGRNLAHLVAAETVAGASSLGTKEQAEKGAGRWEALREHLKGNLAQTGAAAVTKTT